MAASTTAEADDAGPSDPGRGSWTAPLLAVLGLTALLVTRFLIATSDVSAGTPLTTALFDAGANEPVHVQQLGHWWRPITATLLHASPVHLLTNALWLTLLIVLSARLRLFPASAAVVIAVLSAIAGEGASAWAGEGMSVGVSGGIFGLVGALFWRGGVAPPAHIQAWQRWSLLLIGLLAGVSQLAGMSAHVLGVDHVAHLVGLLFGGLLGATSLARSDAAPVQWVWGAVAVALLLTGLVAQGLSTRPVPALIGAFDDWVAEWKWRRPGLPKSLPSIGIRGSLGDDGRCRGSVKDDESPVGLGSDVDCRLVPQAYAVLVGPLQELRTVAPTAFSGPAASAPRREYRLCRYLIDDGDLQLALSFRQRGALIMARKELWESTPKLRTLVRSGLCHDRSSRARE